MAEWNWQHAYRDPEYDFMEATDIGVPTAEGIFSSLRHATTSSELKNVISNYLAGGNDPTVLTDILGGIGSFVGMAGHELPTPDAIKGWFKKDETKGSGSYQSQRFGPWWDRAKEDLAANLYGVLHGGRGNANTTYNSLMNRLITNKKGWLENYLNSMANKIGMDQTMRMKKAGYEGDWSKPNIEFLQDVAPPNIEGNIALNQTPAQVVAQVAASQATQQGNYQAPTMTQQQMVQEAQQTGGTVNPHEATQAAWQPDYSGAVASQQSQAAEAGQTHEQFMSDLDAVMAKGGLVGINHLTRRL